MFGMRAAAFLLSSVLVTGCRYRPEPVMLQGSPAAIAELAGEWAGEYSSSESGRAGSIFFTIIAGKDTAFGDVIMTPTRGQPLSAADSHLPAHQEHVRGPTALRVEFVSVQRGIVRGDIEPYVAPDCECVVNTVFRGSVSGDRIEGSYVTRLPNGRQQEGRWFVSRRR